MRRLRFIDGAVRLNCTVFFGEAAAGSTAYFSHIGLGRYQSADSSAEDAGQYPREAVGIEGKYFYERSGNAEERQDVGAEGREEGKQRGAFEYVAVFDFSAKNIKYEHEYQHGIQRRHGGAGHAYDGGKADVRDKVAHYDYDDHDQPVRQLAVRNFHKIVGAKRYLAYRRGQAGEEDHDGKYYDAAASCQVFGNGYEQFSLRIASVGVDTGGGGAEKSQTKVNDD